SLAGAVAGLDIYEAFVTPGVEGRAERGAHLIALTLTIDAVERLSAKRGGGDGEGPAIAERERLQNAEADARLVVKGRVDADLAFDLEIEAPAIAEAELGEVIRPPCLAEIA